jgi:GTP-binding protein
VNVLLDPKLELTTEPSILPAHTVEGAYTVVGAHMVEGHIRQDASPESAGLGIDMKKFGEEEPESVPTLHFPLSKDRGKSPKDKSSKDRGRGKGRDRSGIGGKDLILRLPLGTQILDETNTFILADMTRIGQKVTIVKGGEGGKGNTFFKSSTNQAPRKSQPGGELEEKWIWLRLKLIADIGLVGLPNAGKSTLLSRITAAKPKIADYPFTTLHPNLGVVNQDDKEFVIADIPGLIEGAHEGLGLGHRFLGHVERCKALLHLVDVTSENIKKDYQTIINELKAYDTNLAEKKQVIVLTKCDAANEDQINFAKKELKKLKINNVLGISAVSGDNITTLIRKLQELVSTNNQNGDIDHDQETINAWSP